MNRITIIPSISLLLAVLCWAPANAAIVQADFTGVVNANNPLVGDPLVGSGITGTFTIDTAILSGAGPNCDGQDNCWSGSNLSWAWNGLDATNSLSYVRISIDDVAPGNGADTYEVTLFGYSSFTTAKLLLTDSSGSAFESAANDLTPLFASFDSATFSYVPLCLTGISCALNRSYQGDLTSLEFVPLPAAGYLFGSALVFLGFVRCRL